MLTVGNLLEGTDEVGEIALLTRQVVRLRASNPCDGAVGPCVASHVVPGGVDVVESSFQQCLRGPPLCFEDEGGEPSQLFARTRELVDRRAERLGITELEVHPGEDSQAVRGRHGRAPTRRPAEGDELLAERAPLGHRARWTPD